MTYNEVETILEGAEQIISLSFGEGPGTVVLRDGVISGAAVALSVVSEEKPLSLISNLNEQIPYEFGDMLVDFAIALIGLLWAVVSYFTDWI